MNILGHEIGKAMADSIEAFVLADAISASGCPVDIITVLKSDAAAPSQELQVLASRSGVTVQGQRATPFWLEPKIIEAPPAAMWEASRHALERRFVNSSGAA